MESISSVPTFKVYGNEKMMYQKSELSVGSGNSAVSQITGLLLAVCSMMLIADFGLYLLCRSNFGFYDFHFDRQNTHEQYTLNTLFCCSERNLHPVVVVICIRSHNWSAR